MLVVGLGNPGVEYSGTRHNIGWMVADRLAEGSGAGFVSFESCALVCRSGGLLLAKPITYMNDSGLAVASLRSFYRIENESILVIFDDLNLPLGMVRVRARGSCGGHKGLQSIIERLGTDEFARIRLGIGPRPDGMDSRDFVLSPFREDERALVGQMIGQACDAVRLWACDGTVKCMNAFNRRVCEQDESQRKQEQNNECSGCG